MANYANVNLFGDPKSSNWEADNLVTIKAPNGQEWRVHKKAAPSMQGLINELSSLGYSPKSSGGFNYRNIRGGTTLSQHAFGNAIDIGAENNALGSTKTDLPAQTAELAKKYGLEWGGTWKSRPDPMHFEWTGGAAPEATTTVAGTTLNSVPGATGGQATVPDKPVVAADGTPQVPPEQKSIASMLGDGDFKGALKQVGNNDMLSGGMKAMSGAMGGQPQSQPTFAQVAPVDMGDDSQRAAGAQQLMASILANKKRPARGLTLGMG